MDPALELFFALREHLTRHTLARTYSHAASGDDPEEIRYTEPKTDNRTSHRQPVAHPGLSSEAKQAIYSKRNAAKQKRERHRLLCAEFNAKARAQGANHAD